MEWDIFNAKSDFERARSFAGNGIEQNVKINLHQAIDKVNKNRDIVMALFKDKLNALGFARASADHAKIFTEFALKYS
ncbi:hypothetical protein [Borrelia persica]|uniref:hypothetical protein n=1 Tax=Borrelia persica TaxID=44448 RepID=UPI00046655D4|nr:hypothetical protein [Borrelia persica]